jgi:hypothetical protein
MERLRTSQKVGLAAGLTILTGLLFFNPRSGIAIFCMSAWLILSIVAVYLQRKGA